MKKNIRKMIAILILISKLKKLITSCLTKMNEKIRTRNIEVIPINLSTIIISKKLISLFFFRYLKFRYLEISAPIPPGTMKYKKKLFMLIINISLVVILFG
tara:strand:+ start:118 stop:420 length:303 start_codon:yes stop_codon:yes gene_type:complete